MPTMVSLGVDYIVVLTECNPQRCTVLASKLVTALEVPAMPAS